MKKLSLLLTPLILTLNMQAADKQHIRISTDNIDLVLQVGDNGRLYQVYFGDKLDAAAEADFSHFDWRIKAGSDGAYGIRGREAYPSSGGEDSFEPALAITHADGNLSTYLYVSRSQVGTNGNISYSTPLVYNFGAQFSEDDLKSILGGAATVDFDGDGISDLLIPRLSKMLLLSVMVLLRSVTLLVR